MQGLDQLTDLIDQAIDVFYAPPSGLEHRDDDGEPPRMA